MFLLLFLSTLFDVNDYRMYWNELFKQKKDTNVILLKGSKKRVVREKRRGQYQKVIGSEFFSLSLFYYYILCIHIRRKEKKVKSTSSAGQGTKALCRVNREPSLRRDFVSSSKQLVK